MFDSITSEMTTMIMVIIIGVIIILYKLDKIEDVIRAAAKMPKKDDTII
jgi:hypothetical protein